MNNTNTNPATDNAPRWMVAEKAPSGKWIRKVIHTRRADAMTDRASRTASTTLCRPVR